MNNDISTDELKAAYHIAQLWRAGISYQRAIDTPLLLRGMTNQVKAQRNRNNRPQQARLELEAS